MNVTSNSTSTDIDNGLTSGALFLVVLSATSAWCVFIMCVVCCSEYRGYQRRGRNRSYETRRSGPVDRENYSEKREQITLGVSAYVNIQQEMSTISPSEEMTNSSIERKDEKRDVFDDQNEEQFSSVDFPTPKNRKSILPPINVGTLISVESKCHGDTSSPSKEMLLTVDSSIRKAKKSQLTPVIVHS